MRRFSTTTLLLALAVSQGCALLVRGKTDTIDVEGTQLEVDGKPVPNGPVELRRRQVHTVSAIVKGQRETRTIESDISTPWFVIDFVVFGIFLCPVGSIMFIVDLATGSLNEFDTTDVSFPKSENTAPTNPASSTLTSAQVEQLGICSHCGTPCGEHAKFCQECGAKR